jgi:hypothetical protein
VFLVSHLLLTVCREYALIFNFNKILFDLFVVILAISIAGNAG